MTKIHTDRQNKVVVMVNNMKTYRKKLKVHFGNLSMSPRFGVHYEEMEKLAKAMNKINDDNFDEVARALLNDLNFIKLTHSKGLSRGFIPLYEELKEIYAEPDSLETSVILKAYKKNQKLKWSNIIIGLLLALLLVLTFLFLR